MKTVRLVVGIITIVLSPLILFVGCAAAMTDQLRSFGVDSTYAYCWLIGGIVSVATRKGNGIGAGVGAGFYILAGILGALVSGTIISFSAITSFVLGIGLIIGGLIKPYEQTKPDSSNYSDTGAPEYIAELNVLAELRDKGAITQEEFDARKKKLLDL